MVVFDGFGIVNSMESGKVLDVSKGSPDAGARIVQWDWHGGDNQRFAIEDLGNAAFVIRAKHSGRVLDLVKASHNDGAMIVQWDGHGRPNQQWKFGHAID